MLHPRALPAAHVITSAAVCVAIILYFGKGPPAPGLIDAVAGADEAGLVGEHDELCTVADGELHHRSVDVGLDCER
jgi:hypothetical protein